MDKRVHRLPALIGFAGDQIEIEIDLVYTITRARPARGPSYASGGEPAEPSEIEVLSGTVVPGNQPVPDWMITMINMSDEAYQALGEAADWGEPRCDPDDERDRRRDDELTMRDRP